MPEALSHPMRVATDLVLGAITELDGLEHLVDPLRPVAAIERRAELEIGATAQIGIKARSLDESRHPFERRHPELRVAAEQANRARRRPDQAQHHPQ